MSYGARKVRIHFTDGHVELHDYDRQKIEDAGVLHIWSTGGETDHWGDTGHWGDKWFPLASIRRWEDDAE